MPTLHHERVTADDGRPARWLYMLHGIYGAGRNWLTIAKRLVAGRPDWGVVLVDLRMHGGSQGFAAPHTLEAAAADLAALGAELPGPIAGVLGHSFGGKVALAYARDHGSDLEQLWIVDSTPEARDPAGSAWEMLQVLRRLPASFESRTAGVEALEAEGVARPVAQWMSTNLEAQDGAYHWRIDLDAMEALLHDFFRTDLWAVVEDPPGDATVHFIQATDSSVLSDSAARRVRDASRAHLHPVQGGHWLNADNPDAVVDLLENHLPG